MESTAGGTLGVHHVSTYFIEVARAADAGAPVAYLVYPVVGAMPAVWAGMAAMGPLFRRRPPWEGG